MFWRRVLQAVCRLAVVLAVALSGISFGADEAEAKRIKVRSSKDHATTHDGQSAARKSHGEDDAASPDVSYVPRVRSREAARSDPSNASDAGGASVRPRSPARRAAARAPEKEIDVPGCPTGMICTVCLAGCDGASGAIIDAQPKTPMTARRE